MQNAATRPIRPREIERVPGYRLRTRELTPRAGEHRRWLIVLNGKPLAIKRTVRRLVEVANYRGDDYTTDIVFCWLPLSEQASAMVGKSRAS